MENDITIGLSACLAGENVRFDGGHRRDAKIMEVMSKCFNLKTFCPELAIGMGVPRQTIKLVRQHSELKTVGFKDDSLDVTEDLKKIILPQLNWIKKLSGYVVKKGSPSCGMERVKVYGPNRVDPVGRGIFTNELMSEFPLLPVEEEGRLNDANLLDSFLHRVYAYYRWNKLNEEQLTPHKLITFHTQYKMILLSRNQSEYRKLGQLVASISSENIHYLAQEYIAIFMQTLKLPASRSNNVNVLQHLQGFLKKHLSAQEKKNMIEVITRYGHGDLPLIAPIILLNNYFQKYKNRFVESTLYLNPFPVELGIYTKI